MLDIRNQQLNTVQSFAENDENLPLDDLEWYGYDPNFPHYNQPEELNQVDVNDIVSDFNNLHNYLTGQRINPLADSPNLGVDIFSCALDICVNLANQL